MYMNQDKYFRENMLIRKNKKKFISNEIGGIKEENKLIFER